MSLVLVIDDDRGTLEGFAGVLRCGGLKVATAETGREGLSSVERCRPDLVLADLQLPDLSGVDVLRELRAGRNWVPVVIVTGFGSIRSAVEAINAGASDFVEKPLIGDDLLRVVDRALGSDGPRTESPAKPPRQSAQSPRAHAAARWAQAVARIVDAPADPRTLKAWGRHIGASPGSLKNWCRIAGLSARHSLHFARLLRAVVRHRLEGYRPADVLDIVDHRTLYRLLQLGGVGEDANDLPCQLDAFLAGQRLIRDAIALREVEQALHALGFHCQRQMSS